MSGRVFQKVAIVLPRSGCRDEFAKDIDSGATCQDSGTQPVPDLMTLEAGMVK